ncbi:MAG TPA: LysM peptidoglycan-binding domain-containing protein [Candidatus Dormibacteraeota bacterium]|nr:LysM peptidoglycan-binding domain-containing protein [Candidatus Dormibacteraeota bacterium]
MDQATPEAAKVAAEPRRSAEPHASEAASSTIQAPLRGCPFLVAEAGGWRLDVPSRAHRCGAVTPPAPLSPEKQARLCLTAAHLTCATLQASLAARGARLGPLAGGGDRTTRWGLARTTTIIEESGGIRTRVLGLLLDRSRWPAIPAVILVVTLLVLAASGLRPTSPAAVEGSPTPATATAAPASAAASSPSATEPASAGPTSTPPTTGATTQPTARSSGTPSPSVAYTNYTVKSGDTLSAIAARYGTTSRAIADLNGITVTTTLHIGQILKIPTR